MANPSLQIGNSNWAIKEDDLLGYSTVGTNYLPKPMTMTRESAGTRVNPEGLVETVELLGSEEVTDGNFPLPNTNWILGGSGSNIPTIGTNDVTINSVDGNSYVGQSGILTIGKYYKITYDVISASATSNVLKLASSFGMGSIPTSVGTQIVYGTAVATSLYIERYTNGVNATITNISAKESTKNNLARVDYTDGTSSLLSEPERTNLIKYSEDFNAYKVASSTVTPNSTTSPDGTNSGILVTQGTNTLVLRVSNVVAPSTTYTFSGYFKSSGSITQVILDITDEGNTTFDLTNEWQRFSVTAESRATGSPYHFVDVATNGSQGDTFYAWGLQVEEASYATSYIPTDGGTVTRVQDQYEKTGISNLINSEEGSFFVDIAALNQPPGSQLSISLSGDNSNDRILIYTGSGGGEWVTQFRKDATSYVTIKKSTTITNQSKVAVSWESGKYLMYIDGIKATNYTAGSETEATTFDLGDLKNLQFSPNHNSTSNFFYGKVKQLQVYKTALTDSELETLTT